MTVLHFWLSLVFGGTEIGFIASGIGTWYYKTELITVPGWTVGTAIVTAIIILRCYAGSWTEQRFQFCSRPGEAPAMWECTSEG